VSSEYAYLKLLA